MDLEESLEEFRSHWRNEIQGAQSGLERSPARKRRRSGGSQEERAGYGEPTAWKVLPGSPTRGNREEGQGSRYLEFAESLLEEKSIPVLTAPTPLGETGEPTSLVEQLIDDLNEINDIPFFDIQLPYEIALQIFQFLGRKELGRCAQNRTGAVSQLHYELGKVLSDVHSCDGVVLAGYTSGDVRLWDTRVSCFDAPHLKATSDLSDLGQKLPVSFVQINRSLAVAAYENGTIDVWSLLSGREPIHHYQHNQKIQVLALCPESTAIATASGFQIKVESTDERGFWHSASIFHTQKLVNFLHLINGNGAHPLVVVAAEEMVFLLKAEESEKVLHSTYGHPVTCLDVSSTQAAFGVKSFGWISNSGNKIHLYNLQTGHCVTTMGNSTGDFTCVNLKDSPPNLIVTGNRDRRVRVHDTRCNKSVCSFYGHHLGVSAVRMDDWKVVSGGEEGLTCVWDQRMSTKLWEIHARHPVRYIWSNSHCLITANIPDDKNPRGASIMDDDLTAHRRHRGTINVHEFSVDQRSSESILPICTSSYSEITGYNYNIGLTVPYDLV
ncbi:hypothetical protein GDO86_002093 [Hymenochirus boettgeri]|uniref:F-box/WD repeat-containing protein 8 n=1 Tax=Hymenochirus boettgeri TaxID=247094 RepID=A0A8T2KFH3_9PIPI|nr:hypothetical protein GDO86_002093 [Hymenochirus boettgeri]